jgi:hypothetical protein
MTEPLDLSKIKLNGIGTDSGDFEYEDSENSADDYEEQGYEDDEDDEEDRFSRGRSRSRSVHSNDDDSGQLIPFSGQNPEDPNSTTSEEGGKNGNRGNNSAVVERTGPLQHREVVALQKVM